MTLYILQHDFLAMLCSFNSLGLVWREQYELEELTRVLFECVMIDGIIKLRSLVEHILCISCASHNLFVHVANLEQSLQLLDLFAHILTRKSLHIGIIFGKLDYLLGWLQHQEKLIWFFNQSLLVGHKVIPFQSYPQIVDRIPPPLIEIIFELFRNTLELHLGTL